MQSHILFRKKVVFISEKPIFWVVYNTRNKNDWFWCHFIQLTVDCWRVVRYCCWWSCKDEIEIEIEIIPIHPKKMSNDGLFDITAEPKTHISFKDITVFIVVHIISHSMRDILGKCGRYDARIWIINFSDYIRNWVHYVHFSNDLEYAANFECDWKVWRGHWKKWVIVWNAISEFLNADRK